MLLVLTEQRQSSANGAPRTASIMHDASVPPKVSPSMTRDAVDGILVGGLKADGG